MTELQSNVKLAEQVVEAFVSLRGKVRDARDDVEVARESLRNRCEGANAEVSDHLLTGGLSWAEQNLFRKSCAEHVLTKEYDLVRGFIQDTGRFSYREGEPVSREVAYLVADISKIEGDDFNKRIAYLGAAFPQALGENPKVADTAQAFFLEQAVA